MKITNELKDKIKDSVLETIKEIIEKVFASISSEQLDYVFQYVNIQAPLEVRKEVNAWFEKIQYGSNTPKESQILSDELKYKVFITLINTQRKQPDYDKEQLSNLVSEELMKRGTEISAETILQTSFFELHDWFTKVRYKDKTLRAIIDYCKWDYNACMNAFQFRRLVYETFSNLGYQLKILEVGKVIKAYFKNENLVNVMYEIIVKK